MASDDCENIINILKPYAWGKIEDESALVLKASMIILAIIGEIGDPIARPFFCSYTLPLHWKYVVIILNRILGV